MPFDVTMPDGTVIKDVPDGTTKAQLSAKYAAHSKVAAKPALGLWERVGRNVADNAASFVEGVTALPDMAATAIGKVAGGAARAIPRLLYGAPLADDIATSLESPFTIGGAVRRVVPEAESNVVGRTLGNAIGGVAGGVGLGGMLAKSGGAVARGVGASLAERPGAQALGGAAAGFAAAGAKAAGAPIPVQMVAALAAGGVTPAAADAAAMGAGRAMAPLTKPYVREQAARILKNNVETEPDAVAARIDAATSRPAVSGALPTTAEVAGDRAIAGFQRTLQGGSNIGGAALTRRFSDNSDMRLRAVDQSLGDGVPGEVVTSGNDVASGLRAAQDSAAGRVGPLAPADVSGDDLRNTLKQNADAAKAEAGARYRNLPGGDEPLQVGAVDEGDLFMDGLAQPDTGSGRRSFEAAGRNATGAAVGRERGLFALIAKQGVNVNGTLGKELRAAGYGPRELPYLFRKNGGIGDPDELIVPAREQGFLGQAGDGLDDVSGADMTDLLMQDIRAMGRNGTGQRVTGADARASGDAAREAEDNRLWWGREFDDRGLDPEKMSPEEWDAMYRDVEGLGPREVTQADHAFIADEADKAAGKALLSPFQASLIELQRQFFPAGLPANSSVKYLIRQLVNADTMTATQVERVGRDLRRQAGLLKGSDGVSSGLAKAAGNAVDGFLSATAGPARAEALAAARAGYRDYKTTFANGEPGKVLATDQYGRETLDVARVPAVATPKGVTGGTATRRLVAAAGPESAQKAAREELRRALNTAGSDTGKIDRLTSADGYGSLLAEFPDLARDVAGAREVAALGEAFAVSPLGKLRGAADPVTEISTLLRKQDNGVSIRRLIEQVRGNDAAEGGLRRAMAEQIKTFSASRSAVNEAGRPEAVNNAFRGAVKNVLDRTARSDILSRDQRSVLLNVHRETKGAQFAATANRAPGSDTVRNAAMWGQFASVVANGIPKGTGIKTVLDLAISVMGRAEAVRDLTTQAMLDPKLAADLLRTPTPDRVKSLSERMVAYASGANLGAVAATGNHSPANK